MWTITALFHNDCLRSLDGAPITLDERLNGFARRYPKAPVRERGMYNVNLRITVSATPAEGRRYLPESCRSGVQWDPNTVERLNNLMNLGVSNQADIGFSKFSNLKQLNLVRNRILSQCKKKKRKNFPHNFFFFFAES
jgi:hypothetical protein